MCPSYQNHVSLQECYCARQYDLYLVRKKKVSHPTYELGRLETSGDTETGYEIRKTVSHFLYQAGYQFLCFLSKNLFVYLLK
jgi:hypothetical protein